LKSENNRVCVVGVGTIGYPTARAIRESGFEVYGYDIDETKSSRAKDLVVLSNWDELPTCSIYVLCLPTELTNGVPDFSALREAAKNIARSRPGGRVLICVESTVSPGECRLLSETLRGTLLVHVPHRYWSKDPLHHGVRQRRIIGALDSDSMGAGLRFYKRLGIPLHKLASLEEAEMTKIVENSYRFVQIAFAEEVALLCEGLKIDWRAVRTAANTKWNISIPEARSGIDGCLAKDIRFLIQRSNSEDQHLLRGGIDTDSEYRTTVSRRREKNGRRKSS